jgi:ParB family chromosome partitioning protein
MAKQALGRGLGALMGGVSGAAKAPAASPAPAPTANASLPAKPAAGEAVERVPVDRIQPCAFQPRKDFHDGSLQELADSIREQGVIQPLVVRPREGGYELIAGERRWRAAKLAGLGEVPVIVREADDRKVLELALIENLQRENLNPIEEALGYNKLMQEFQLTQEEASKRVGKSRATVANILRLLSLHPDAQTYVRNGLLSFGHARSILGMAHSESQKQLAEQVIKDGLSVRETEEIVARRNESAVSEPAAKAVNGALRPNYTADANIVSLQNKLQERFGTKVLLRYRKGKGAVEIRFFNDDDLDRVLGIFGVSAD